MPEAVDQLWILASAALVMSMQVGFCMLEAGLVRSKNSINVAIKNLIDFCVAALLFWAFGFALMFGASAGGWVGTSGFLAGPGLGPAALTFLVFQIMFCATTATIVSGAVAERMSFASYVLVTAAVSGILYPIAGGWAWNEHGWLRELGFRDFAGSSVVHSVGGWVSLAAVSILGARMGRYDSKTALVSSHSLVISTVGVLVLFVGWMGFNGGSTLALNAAVPLILVNTTVAGAAGCLAALGAVWWHKKLPELPATLNGCIGGLVAITANCNAVTPAEALVIGAIGGVLSYAAIHALEAMRLDDVVGASAAHGLPGVWGTLAVGVFGDSSVLGTGLAAPQQVGVQAFGALVYFAWAFGAGWLILKAINHFRPLRIDPDSERVGLNVSEHGASTEIIDLLNEMTRHSGKGEFDRRLIFEPFTEVGQIASEYNRVIDKVIEEMEMREEIASRLRTARNESETVNRKILSSLEYASKIQQAILPGPRLLRETLGDHFVIYEPRDFVSGDFYWCHTHAGRRFVALVDCTGHGVPGAFMSMIGYLLLEHVIVEKQIFDPATILGEMHLRVRQVMAQDTPGGSGNRDGMEVALVRIDENQIVFAGAHRPLWWFRREGEEIHSGEISGDRHGLGGGQLEPHGIVFSQHTLPIQPGLSIYLQTDGLVQQPDHSRRVYDSKRLEQLLTNIHTMGMAEQREAIMDSFREFRGGSVQRDDVTLLGWRFPEAAPKEVPRESVTPAIESAGGETLFSAKSPITSRVIAECGTALRERTRLTVGRRLALFGVFVEIAQNVACHSAETGAGESSGIGRIFVIEEKDAFLVGSDNLIDESKVAGLLARFEEIAGLEPAGLEQLYLRKLHQKEASAGLAGLGLIDIARKSAGRLDFRLEPAASGKFLLSLRARVHKTG